MTQCTNCIKQCEDKAFVAGIGFYCKPEDLAENTNFASIWRSSFCSDTFFNPPPPNNKMKVATFHGEGEGKPLNLVWCLTSQYSPEETNVIK